MIIKSQKLRDASRGQFCTLRFPGICNGNRETTVLAHVPCGMRGAGMKGPDNIAVDACSACHTHLDTAGNESIDWRQVIRALAETQQRRIEAGLIKISGVKV